MLLDVLAYLVARLLLAAVLTVVIVLGAHALGIVDFPVVIAVLFAIVIALPLGIWVFAPLRRRATASIAAVDARRRRDREQLQSRLRGEGSSDQ
jgi:ABC-type proline/glycine betaine transport system permease subunit